MNVVNVKRLCSALVLAFLAAAVALVPQFLRLDSVAAQTTGTTPTGSTTGTIGTTPSGTATGTIGTTPTGTSTVPPLSATEYVSSGDVHRVGKGLAD